MIAHGFDYNLKHAPVSRMSTLRTVFSLAVRLKLNMHQIDVMTAFMNVYLDHETIFLRPQQGYEILIQTCKPIRLSEALFGSKEAS